MKRYWFKILASLGLLTSFVLWVAETVVADPAPFGKSFEIFVAVSVWWVLGFLDHADDHLRSLAESARVIADWHAAEETDEP